VSLLHEPFGITGLYTRGHHGDVFAFRLLEGDSVPRLPAARQVLDVWRRALLSRADQPVVEAISGHCPGSTVARPRPSSRPHMALLPVADVGHMAASGDLLGVGAALPREVAASERRACVAALDRVTALTLGRLGVWRLEPWVVESAGSDGTGLLNPWLSPSDTWESVTPVVFGRYPRRPWGEEAARVVREACGIAGLPEPVEVALSPRSAVHGVPPASEFPAAAREGRPRRFHAHARLVFREPVAGPVLVGAERHQGYGVFVGVGPSRGLSSRSRL